MGLGPTVKVPNDIPRVSALLEQYAAQVAELRTLVAPVIAAADPRDVYTDKRLLRYILSFKGSPAKAAAAIVKVMPFRLKHADVLAEAREGTNKFAFGASEEEGEGGVMNRGGD